MKHLILSAILLSGSALALGAQEPAGQAAQAQANEQRLRDTLRATTQRLAAAEAERATALASQAEGEAKVAALEAQVAALVKSRAEDQAAADQAAAKFKASLLAQEQAVASLTSSLNQWKKAHQQVSGAARKMESERARLHAANLLLERKVADREASNLKLYRTGREVLARFANFSLGRAIAAREPFTGIAKAQLEEQIQDYADQLQDHKLAPAPSDGQPSTRPTPEGKPR